MAGCGNEAVSENQIAGGACNTRGRFACPERFGACRVLVAAAWAPAVSCMALEGAKDCGECAARICAGGAFGERAASGSPHRGCVPSSCSNGASSFWRSATPTWCACTVTHRRAASASSNVWQRRRRVCHPNAIARSAASTSSSKGGQHAAAEWPNAPAVSPP